MPEIKDPALFRSILDSLQTGVCVTDREGRILFWNDGAERITGYRRHEVVGHLSGENILLHCNRKACALCGPSCPLALSLQNGKSNELQMHLHHHTGDQVPVHVWTVPVRDDHGTILLLAQSFDVPMADQAHDRRQNTLAAYGCLDETTGVPNHAFTYFQLRESLASFAQHHVPFGIITLRATDIEKFRVTYGRAAVDTLLSVFARTMKNTLPPSHFVGRWQEDQFLGILPNCSQVELHGFAEQLAKVAGHARIQWWGDELSVATTLGYALVRSGDEWEALLARAESVNLPLSQSASASSGGDTPHKG
ncbi:MAG: diguanylate cyclase [Acidobacteria bacterium]|nr:diguanylate cyclase [Acidobacteriota bacterium]